MCIQRFTYHGFLTVFFIAALSGCGEPVTADHINDIESNCPPAPKPGLSAIERVGGMNSFEKYSQWQTALPPKSCAGDLASFIPDLPPGYGLPPSVRPPLITESHVYLKYVKIPAASNDQSLAMINFAGQPQFEFEIIQLSNDQAVTFSAWLKNNKQSYTEYPIEGRMFYAVGGGGWYLPGNKLTGGIGTILDNNVLIKFTMPKIYSDKSVVTPVAHMFHTIALKHGL